MSNQKLIRLFETIADEEGLDIQDWSIGSKHWHLHLRRRRDGAVTRVCLPYGSGHSSSANHIRRDLRRFARGTYDDLSSCNRADIKRPIRTVAR